MLQPSEPEAPADRRRRGEQAYLDIVTMPVPPQDSPFRCAGTDFIFADVWTRPGLDIKARRWITLACTAASDAVSAINAHVVAALRSGDIALVEMQEFVLQFAAYCGWPKASIVEQLYREAWQAIARDDGGPSAWPGFASAADPVTATARHARGLAWHRHVMTISPAATVPLDTALIDFVFGEIWCRPGLDTGARRLISLAAIGASDAPGLLADHCYAALRSGDLTLAQMEELALQFALYAGWAKAGALRDATRDSWLRVEREGGPAPSAAPPTWPAKEIRP